MAFRPEGRDPLDLSLLLLRTFGGLSIEVESGESPTPLMGPRRLALLALLAASGSQGLTRERIVGILWAETDEEQARHTLSQTLYLLRRESGRAWVTGAGQLRLHDSITSDVRDFQEALRVEDLARACACYTGPFLDGFYLSGAPAFEEWVEVTRSTFRFAALKALQTLAQRHAEAGAHAEALQYWQRLNELDPYAAPFAAGRLRAHVALGDRIGGLRYADEYESRVRRELETRPDSAVVELITSLRAAPRDDAAAASVAAPSAAAQPAPEPIRQATRPARSRLRAWVPVVAGAAAVAIAAAAWGIGRREAPAGPAPALAIGFISSRDTTATGPVLRDMLATNLARVSGIRVVANSRLLELLPSRSNATSSIADAARRAGATELMEGELGTTPNGYALTLRRVSLQTGVVRQGYSVRARDAYALIDSATAAIAHDFNLDPPPDAVATVRTSSAVAYALYEEGLRGYYGGDPAGAYSATTAALERDSTFAMAAYIAWSAANITHRYEEAVRLRPLVERLASRATDRERLIIQAALGREDAPMSEYLPVARELATTFPTDPDGQIGLGFALAHAGDWAGSVAAFNRAIAIDSAAGATTARFCRVCTAMAGMANSYLWWDSLPAARRLGPRLLRLRPDEPYAWAIMVEPLLREGRRAEAEAAITRAAGMTAVRGNFAPVLDRGLIRSGFLNELETRYLSAIESAPPDSRTEIPWLLTINLRNQGRLREARALAADGTVPKLGRRIPRHQPDLLSLGIIALEAGAPRVGARYFLAAVQTDRAWNARPGIKARALSWHMTLAGTALAAAGDTAAVRALADSVERIAARSSFGRDYKLPSFLQGLLLQREGRHAEAVEAFRRSLFSVTEGYTRTNLEMARSLMALRRYAEAIAILQPAFRGGVDGSNTYVTFPDLHFALAQAFEAAGQRDSARVHYAAVAKAWRRSDPQFTARYREAQAKAAQTN